MATSDTCVSIHPYFRLPGDKLADAHAFCERFVERTKSEAGCLYYGFSFSENMMHCREAYADADGLLNHLQNVGPLIEEMLSTGVTIERLEVHGPAEEIEKLRGPMADLSPQFFVLEFGFRN
ncbi:MAG: hypothetical protein SynsKO_33350 [Synoicihabitans sp.]